MELYYLSRKNKDPDQLQCYRASGQCLCVHIYYIKNAFEKPEEEQFAKYH